MNLSNFYFQYIKNINYQQDINKFVEKNPLTKFKFDQIDLSYLKISIPNIYNWFNENNLKLNIALLINQPPGHTLNIHSDYTPYGNKLSLNIPLNVESENSLTIIYDLKKGCYPKLIYKKNGLSYFEYETAHVIKKTEYKSTSPSLLNISKPHSAWNNTCFMRGVLSFRFEKDPIHLIKEEIV